MFYYISHNIVSVNNLIYVPRFLHRKGICFLFVSIVNETLNLIPLAVPVHYSCGAASEAEYQRR